MCVAVDLVPSSDFAFVDRVDERLTCPICKKVFKEPWQTQCGHRFCEHCLQWLLSRQEHPRCPVDGEEIKTSEVFPDRCCAREVLDLQCFCRFTERTCEWRGEFRHIQEHEANCQFGDVQCHACGQILERRHLDEHRVDACVNREIACAFCGRDVLHSNIKDHLQVCLKAPIPCILNCGADAIPRDMMEEHVTSLCPKAEVLCPFSDQGCDFKGSKEALDQHLEDEIKSHLDLMNLSSQQYNNARMDMEKKILGLENEKQAMAEQICSQIEEIAAARQNLTILQTKTSIIETSVCEQKKEMEKLRLDLEAASNSVNGEAVSSQMEEVIITMRAQEQKINNLQCELARFNTSGQKPRAHEVRNSSLSAAGCDLRLDRTEHQLALHEIELADQDIRMQMIEATSYDGVYLWKIDHYSRRFQEAVSEKTPSIYSPPFFVGRFGYKVCARLYPNGDGMGKGTHMSLFFVIMRGEYDALLPWPFTQKVHFKLLDQQRVRDTVDTFRPDPNSSSFKRPSSTMNIASGFPTFISQKSLREGGYVRDDTVFIKITVDMTTLQGDAWR